MNGRTTPKKKKTVFVIWTQVAAKEAEKHSFNSEQLCPAKNGYYLKLREI